MEISDLNKLGLEYEINDNELLVFHGNIFTRFQWPLTFGWSLKMLRWQAYDRLGLRNPDWLPPRDAYE